MNWKPLLFLFTAGITQAALPPLTDEGALNAAASNPAIVHELACQQFQEIMGDDANSDIGRIVQSSRSLMADFLGSGSFLDDPKKALRVLGMLYKEDGNSWTDPKNRTTAVAIALTFGSSKLKWPEDKAIERYKIYRESQRAGKLHPSFDELEAWEKRFVVAYSQNNEYIAGNYDNEALLWQRDNVKLPIEGYIGACWQAPYRRHNVFGDSIHGKNFYMPFEMNHALRVREVGGVCGSLSHFGANAARANGIPALAMGEPGHCAYAVRLKRGVWKACYSLSWQRGVHTGFLGGTTWTDLVSYEAMMDDLPKYRLSQAYGWLGNSLRESDPVLAKASYNLALMTQPLNFQAWTDLIDWLEKEGKTDATVWSSLHASVLKAFRDYPESGWRICKRIETIAAPAMTRDQRVVLFSSVHSAMAKTDGPIAWNYGDVFKEQIKLLQLDAAGQLNFFAKNLAVLAGSKSWFAPSIAWGHEQFSGQPGWFNLLSNVLTSEAAANNTEGLKNALRPAILSAENADNVAAFQALGRVGKSMAKSKGTNFPPFDGELLSSGGLLRLSSSCKSWDSPESHWGILEQDGGMFHTDTSDTKPWAIARLGKLGDVSGIVIANGNNGNGNRLVPLTVSISEDGRTWQEVFRTTNPKGPWRIDLQGKAPRVQFVKVMRDDDRQEFFHLSSILVYGRRLQ